MTVPLRVLVIDETESDFQHAIVTLREGGYETSAQRVDRRGRLDLALRKDWDLILVEWRLRTLEGLDVLGDASTRRMIPCIVMSGVTGEETVVEALRAGALDFVAKDKVRTHLVPAVHRALREATTARGRREAEQALAVSQTKVRESEERFRVMADTAPVMLWMSGIEGECDFFNRGWTDFTGRTLAQEYGVGWAEGVYFEDFPHCMSVYLSAFVKREPFRMEYRLRRNDGQYRWILDTGIPRFGPGLEFAGYIGSCIDITELREARDTLRRQLGACTLPFGAYARSLITVMHASGPATIALRMQIEEIAFGLDRAVALGVILDELVSNVLRHAFRGRNAGTLTVSLTRLAPDRALLAVTDDGVGLPTGVDLRHAANGGMQIVQRIVAQLGASLVVKPRTPGLEVAVELSAQ